MIASMIARLLNFKNFIKLLTSARTPPPPTPAPSQRERERERERERGHHCSSFVNPSSLSNMLPTLLWQVLVSIKLSLCLMEVSSTVLKSSLMQY